MWKSIPINFFPLPSFITFSLHKNKQSLQSFKIFISSLVILSLFLCFLASGFLLFLFLTLNLLKYLVFYFLSCYHLSMNFISFPFLCPIYFLPFKTQIIIILNCPSVIFYFKRIYVDVSKFILKNS